MRKRRHIVGITQPKSKPAPDPFRGFKVGDTVHVTTELPGNRRVWSICGLYNDSPSTGPYVGIVHPDVSRERYAIVDSLVHASAPPPGREFKRGDRVRVRRDFFDRFNRMHREQADLYHSLTYDVVDLTLDDGTRRALVQHTGTRFIRFTVALSYLMLVPPDAA
jgi:hypothetical protein